MKGSGNTQGKSETGSENTQAKAVRAQGKAVKNERASVSSHLPRADRDGDGLRVPLLALRLLAQRHVPAPKYFLDQNTDMPCWFQQTTGGGVSE